MNYEPDDEKGYIKPVVEILEEEDLKIKTIIKSKKRFGESEKKNWANRDKISHYQQIQE